MNRTVLTSFTIFCFLSTVFLLGLSFNIQMVRASGTIYVRVDGSIEPLAASISSVDNVTYVLTDDIYDEIVIERNNITVDGKGHVLYGLGDGIGFSLTSVKNVTIQNTEIQNYKYGIWLSVSSGNTFFGNNMANNEYGIWLSVSSGNTFFGNNMTDNYAGVYLYGSSNGNTFFGNSMANNEYGIRLYGSSNSNTFFGNNITANNEYGVYLSGSSGNTFFGNSMANNEYGIRVYVSSNGNTFFGNSMADNYVGVYFFGSSNGNTFFGNSMADNYVGVYFFGSSNGNTFFHNNLVDNTQQVDFYVAGVNFWDNGFEGNYWSDYTGGDLDNDGIGDFSYVMDVSNIDNYPLMGMFLSFNTSLGYNVNVISNSTIDAFQYFEFNNTIKMYVSNLTANQTFGFCRVCIPKDLIAPPCNVTINDGAIEVLHFNDTIYDNDTHRWIYFAYQHSVHEIVIVPEFPSFIILSLFMMSTLLAVIVYKKRVRKGINSYQGFSGYFLCVFLKRFPSGLSQSSTTKVCLAFGFFISQDFMNLSPMVVHESSYD